MSQPIRILLLIGIILTLVYGSGFIISVLPEFAVSLLDWRTDSEETEEEMYNQQLPLAVPSGFVISVFADGLDGPRVLARDPSGNLIVSLTRAGKIVALPDDNMDGVADREVTVIDGLKRPHGLLFRCSKSDSGVGEKCLLYVAEEGTLSEYQYDVETSRAFGRREIARLPTVGGGHFTRTLLEDPRSERLLVSVGSSCNVCVEDDPRRAAILSTSVDDGALDIYARGLRNAVFMATHPTRGEVFVTENGRDLLGDDVPPDEVNVIREGSNYGWPTCYGKNVHDTDFDRNTYIRNPCMEPFEVPSHIDIPAHSAPLGLVFVPEGGWPKDYWLDLIVAYHGSWNRSEKTGYKLVRLKLDEQGNFQGAEDFITGWLTEEGGVIGRPVDVRIEEGGVMYITDDHAGVVYVVSRAEK